MELFTRHAFRSAGSSDGRQRSQRLAALAISAIFAGAAFGAQPAAAAPSCTPVAGLPAYTPATCVSQAQEQDDGMLETESRYLSTHRADTIRRFFERSFGGWSLVGVKRDFADGEFEYRLAQGARFVKLEVEARDFDDGGGTRITIRETAPLAAVACAPIGGLPAYTPATCTDAGSEIDDGVPESRSEFTTAHAADTVRQFYERAAPAAGWTLLGTDHDFEDGEWQYVYGQGGRFLKIEVDTSFGATGPITRIKLSTKG